MDVQAELGAEPTRLRVVLRPHPGALNTQAPEGVSFQYESVLQAGESPAFAFSKVGVVGSFLGPCALGSPQTSQPGSHPCL